MLPYRSKYFAHSHTLNPGVGSNGQNIFSLKEVMLHIKLMGTMKANILSLHLASNHRVGSKGQILFKKGHVAYQIKGKKCRPTRKFKL